ncbi:MAG: ABC transporter permease [Dehalococcoidales bacterium]|jgi:ABC-2 type transport system permease protein
MNKTYLIFNHEFRTTLRRVGFIVMTFIVPLIALLAIGAYHVISGAVKPSVKITDIGYVDKVGGFSNFTSQGNIVLVPYASTDEANQALSAKAIKEYFVISPQYMQYGLLNYYTLEKQLTPPQATLTAIKNFLTGNLLADKVPNTTIALVEESLNVVATRLTDSGAVSPEQGGIGNLLIPGIFSLLLVLSITFASSYLIQGLGDEKENRLIEVLLSSVSVRQLIIGKVLGLGAAGLLQVLVWVISAPLLLGLASSSIGGFFASLKVTPGFMILCLTYFILGYLLFAMISTAIGAMSPSAREGQQFATLFTLPAIAPLWFSSTILLFPNSPVWVVFTIFPITAPVVLMLRLGATDVAAWQIIVSILVILLSITGGMLLTARIVRTYLLMYGKRPSLGEIVRNLRNG